MKDMIMALNLTEGSVLTLEKMPDRMEFEAMAAMLGAVNKGDDCMVDTCLIYVSCGNCNDVCECVGPRYINCHPYRG